jgi:hypothetical protein
MNDIDLRSALEAPLRPAPYRDTPEPPPPPPERGGAGRRLLGLAVRLAQVQNPPSNALVLLDDPTHLNDAGPVCVDSQSTPPIDPQAGAPLLDLRVNF